ncbi:Vam7p [Kluyveromyces lactis]|uniref:KLLA0A01672p n=1 Tax=Kluyveromyces lactis (strain ATCC 8585 / CBS 2359 / DSM 70799 / NBRC 1267 / NRRL Y-1140 / WM37) TaxID=284590 RepID=Q6CYB6_KLULA|nr:uncharacterized protein KLLA0_A01672g [Kluyveromyces lactis]CAH02661.1 KLLA0A01672p [Kluyveromyces lactis]|eukprot:XP_451073.1 uncharacterized protein KLLA0_A01672g [Kluyveromyces lactis]
MDRGMRCEVSINDVTIVEKRYALYHIIVNVIRSKEDYSEYKSERRFKDFLQLKKQLEYECSGELPYELPGRRLLWSRTANSCDPDVVEERRVKLRQFLSDLLNDSFETKWRNSSLVAQFLNLPEGWYIKSSTKSGNSFTKETIKDGTNPDDALDPSKWLVVLRESKSEFYNGAHDTRTVMKQRLVLDNLEQGLKVIEKEELVSKMECERRKQLLATFKNDLNETIQPASWNKHNNDREELLYKDYQNKFEEPKIGKGRKLGETSETSDLNNQQILQLHKDTINDQDEQLHKLHEIVQQQKNISLVLNQELEAQNELLDMFQDETQASANKLRTANRNAVKFNQGQR